MAKCFVCGQQIPDVKADGIAKVMTKPKNPNTKPTAKYCHEKCRQIALKRQAAKNALYDYTVETYFQNFVPPLLLKRYEELHKYYSYEIILGCLQWLEDEIRGVHWKDDSHKCNGINYMLRQNIQDYERKCAERDVAYFANAATYIPSADVVTRPKPAEVEIYDIFANG